MIGAFIQEKALDEAFSVIVKLRTFISSSTAGSLAFFVRKPQKMPRVRRNQLIVPNTDSLNLVDTRTALLVGPSIKPRNYFQPSGPKNVVVS